MTRANILLVDDRQENLVALQAVLEPLGQNLVSARSGEEALRELLKQEFAIILLDVQMPGFDGFQTAELIKQREQTKHVPIIFVTAISKDAEHVFRGYSAGAVDYILKPIDPDVLRSKVSVFIQLWEKEQQLAEQAELLREHEVAEAVRESEVRYRSLAAALPAIVWQTDSDGNAFYYNERWFEYTGIDSEAAGPADWQLVIHPDELLDTFARWEEASQAGRVFESEYRFRREDGVYRWHLARAVPVREADGTITSWIGTAVDIEDRKRADEGQRFLVHAGAILGRSLHYEQALADMARAAVPGIADWCMVDLLEPDGSLRLLAAAHVDAIKVKLAHELRERYPPPPDSDRGAVHVIRTGEPQLAESITDEMIDENARDEIHRDLLRELGIRSYLSVPLRARDRTIGAITFVHAESGRTYGPNDLGLAEELARRAGMAIENAELYEEVEKRAEAARVLESVGDGVVLVDREGVIRLWNPAAQAITGLATGEVEGRVAREVVPGWTQLEPRIPVGTHGSVRAEMLPIYIGGRELWLSISGVGLDEGTVYAFRDLTEERALEQLKSDFVATVSHEIRTPLAAVHGAALTLLRPDLTLSDELRDRLLAVVAEESDRLAQIVNDLLIASHLDSGRLPVSIESCDAKELAESVVEAASLSVPDGITVSLTAPARLPRVAADPGQLRQVLANLVDNAIKYSPGGGPVELRLARSDAFMRFEVEDRGLGIPPNEHRRVFEKFYRLDPNMTYGVGGTGLGLYISRELVRTMDGRISVESKLGEGSTFLVEIPLARKPRGTRRPREKATSKA
jgi:PAS domain S-box-containing protein